MHKISSGTCKKDRQHKMNDLIPEEIKKQIPPLYTTEDQKNPIAFCKIFLDSSWSWYITELSIDGNICFGYVVSPFCDGELGYFSLEEINAIKGSLGIGAERDLQFKPTPLSTIKKAS